ncbi:MAG TPA: PAS domain S-box protein [Pirellulales bacterium]|nr:PAS domain S-box protein [Pirellulales bacterium]
MSWRQYSKLLPYLVAFLIIVASSLIISLFATSSSVLIAIYVAAVAAVSWYGGLGPALFATGLSYLIANWFFVPSQDAFRPSAAAFVYLFVCMSIGLFSEISKRAVRRARTNAEQVRLVVESITDGFVVVDSSWRLIYMNRATEEYNRRHLLDGNSPGSDGTFPLTVGDAARDRLRRAAAERATIEFEDFYIPWQRWFEFKAAPTDEGGLAIYFRDVTERRRSDDEARKLALIIESTEDAVIGLDLNANVTSWNQAAEKLYGYKAEEIVGRSVLMILPPDQVDEEKRILSAVRRGELVRHFDTVRMRKGGRPVEVSLSVSVIRDDSGQIVGFSKIARDVSDRKRAEKALLEADRRKDDFLALLGHELRNPLAGIVSGVEVLNQLPAGDPDVRNVLAIIERQAAHMSRLIDDLLDVSRIVRGKITLDLARLDLALVVRQSAADHKSQFEQKQLAFDVQTPSHPVWVEGDSVRLAQVVGNLLDNAVKFTDAGGRISTRVSLDTDTSRAVVEVCDTGIGMTPDTIGSLFEPFAQAEESLERSSGGLGLGLAVVKGLIELHNGTIEATSAGAGQGATFTIRLPTCMSPHPKNQLTDNGSQVTDTLRVLVVDDNRDVLHVVSKLLQLGGHTVATAHDGSSGVELAREFQPDLVLCDIGLPGEMNGYKVAEALRADPATRWTRLVAVTGFGQEEDRRRALAAGFDRHLTKPVGYAELVTLIADIDQG